MLTKQLSRFEGSLALLFVVSLFGIGIQTYRLSDITSHHSFAIQTVNDLTFANQQCESVNAQCCK